MEKKDVRAWEKRGRIRRRILNEDTQGKLH